jgi:hypothetical protein
VSRRRQAASLSQLRLLDAAEVNPASSLCQRWSGGAHSWRRRRDGGFDRRLYATYRVDKQVAKTFVERHHYLHSFVAEQLSWGLYQGEELVGVAVFGVPSHPAVLTNVFPDLEPSLNRWDCLPTDTASDSGARSVRTDPGALTHSDVGDGWPERAWHSARYICHGQGVGDGGNRHPGGAQQRAVGGGQDRQRAHSPPVADQVDRGAVGRQHQRPADRA